jgi:hypothetical protein
MVQLELERAETMRGPTAVKRFVLTEDDAREIRTPKVPSHPHVCIYRIDTWREKKRRRKFSGEREREKEGGREYVVI